MDRENALTSEKVEAAPDITPEDVATEDEKALAAAIRTLARVLEKVKGDPGAIFEPEAIQALVSVKCGSPPEWARTRKLLQKCRVSLRDLDRAMRLQQPAVAGGSSNAYVGSGRGIIWLKQTDSGVTEVQLTNFNAKIIGDVVLDDGNETRRRFEIRTELEGRNATIEVPSSQFAGMSWVAEHLGARAIVSPGFGLRDHARAAVQFLSEDVVERHLYTHAGWRRINGVWVFLNGGGALGADFHVGMALDKALERYVLPSAVSKDAARGAVRRSIGLLKVAPMRVTVPMLSAIFYSPLTTFLDPDFVLWLYGRTGSLKTSLTAVFVSHFGASFTRTSLPADWHSTANYLEKISFLAKDLPFLIDDFAPAKNPHEASELERKASYLIRAIGNRSGRGRMRSDTSLRVPNVPRCFLFSTGEQVPSGQSEMARMLALELRREDVNLPALTEAQEHARELAAGMSHFLLNLRGSLGGVGVLRESWEQCRAKILGNTAHLRSPEIAAHLVLGLDLFITTAHDLGVVSNNQAEELRAEGLTAITEAVREHDVRIQGEDPIIRFAAILIELETQGQISLNGATGPRTEMIGWHDSNTGHLLVLSEASYRCVVRFCRDAGGYFPLKSVALHKALHDAGVLIRDEDGRLAGRAHPPGGEERTRVLRLIEAKFRALAS